MHSQLPSLQPYEPLDVPKQLDERLWIVDGPIVRMRYVVGSLPFSTRMTIVRLRDGRLWVHSPVALTPGLEEAVAALGAVTWLVAPNRLHWMALGAWQSAFPAAVTYAAPDVVPKQGAHGFRIDHRLEAVAPTQWRGELQQTLVPGSFMTEAVFLHVATRTLIVADLIENFERQRISSRWLRWLMRIGGVMSPHGGTPRDLRLTFLPKRAAVRRAAETMIGWQPRRIVLSHGLCIEHAAAEELQRVFHWTGLETP
jgi:hypothetical protein